MSASTVFRSDDARECAGVDLLLYANSISCTLRGPSLRRISGSILMRRTDLAGELQLKRQIAELDYLLGWEMVASLASFRGRSGESFLIPALAILGDDLRWFATMRGETPQNSASIDAA